MTYRELPWIEDSPTAQLFDDANGCPGQIEPIQVRHARPGFEPADFALPNAGLSPAVAVCRTPLEQCGRRANLSLWTVSFLGEAS